MPEPVPGSQPSRAPRSSGTIVLAALLDVVLLLAFVLIGRGSHGENVIGGALVTFWPFAVGLVVGWLACLAWRRPMAMWPTGVVVWVSTLVIGGALVTFWPFAVGLVVGWLACLAWRRPMAMWPTGVVVWVSTLVIGMILRVVSEQGIAVSFVIVAAIVLAVFLIGWRAVAVLVTTIRRRRSTARTTPAVDGVSR
jgi:hypothetical protein